MSKITEEWNVPKSPKKAKHTALPWNVKQYDSGKQRILGADDTPITDLTNSFMPTEYNANAEFIVKAVNCHDELVKALKDIQQNIQTALFAQSIPQLWGESCLDITVQVLAKTGEK